MQDTKPRGADLRRYYALRTWDFFHAPWSVKCEVRWCPYKPELYGPGLLLSTFCAKHRAEHDIRVDREYEPVSVGRGVDDSEPF